MNPSAEIQYVTQDGRLTYDGLALFQAIVAYIVALEARVTVLDGGPP